MDIEELRRSDAPVPAPDREAFERVWRRVMPDEEASPIGLGPARSEGAEGAAPDREASVPTLAAQEEAQYAAPCLGESSLTYTQLLQELMDDAQCGWQTYRALTYQARGQVNRQLGALAADQRLCLRRLGAVYFLLTGRRDRRPDRAPGPLPALPDALRERFSAEQALRAKCLQGAQEVRDFCLASLCQELAVRAQERMEGIRRVLEGL